MTDDKPVPQKPCPKCGSKNRLPAPQQQWCADCGAISCPKCGSTRVVSSKIKGWELPSISCQICSERVEVQENPTLNIDASTFRQLGIARSNMREKVPCPVIGCNEQMLTGMEMCARCKKKLSKWKLTNMLTPPPIAKDKKGRLILLTEEAKKAMVAKWAA